MSTATICPFCAVGCGLVAEASAPMPRFRGDPTHPVNHGALCARGAAATFEAFSRARLTQPLRRAPGSAAWSPVSWDEALDRTAGAILDARARTWDDARAATSGIAFFGGATAMNEEAYLFARLARALGVLDLDHQGRTCHAATTAGLRATLGAAAATHDWIDLLDARWIVVIGSNPADAHPIAARYLSGARARGARVIVVDPRASRTARGSDRHLPIRPGTDLALLCGLIGAVLARDRPDRAWLAAHTDAAWRVARAAELDPTTGRFGGWDAAQRRYDDACWAYEGIGDLDDPGSVLSALRRHFSRFTPEMTAALTGLPPQDIRDVADAVCDGQAGAILFSMGVTQQLSGVATVRAAAILQALLGNLDRAGGGLFPMKGHANIQGATDLGGLYSHLPGDLPAPTTDTPTLDAYAQRHGHAPATHLARCLEAWFDEGASAYARLPRRRDTDHHSLHAALARGETEVMVLLGQNPVHGSGNPRAVADRLRRVRLLVSIDPFVTDTAAFWEQDPDSETEVIALPSAMFAEKPGSRTNACRRVQWQDACIAPRPGARPDAWIIDQLRRRLSKVLAGTRWPQADTVDGLYAATFAEMAQACWMYAGAGRDPHGWHWPAGSPRVRDAFPRRVRLWAGPCEMDGWHLESIGDGPLPEYYTPPGTGENPLHPAQPSNPLLEVETTQGFPLVLSTSMTETDGRRCAPAGAGPERLELRAPRALCARLDLADGSRVWLETPGRRAAAVLRVVDVEDRGVVWAPSSWSTAADDTSLRAVVDPGDRFTLLDDVRMVACRITPRPL